MALISKNSLDMSGTRLGPYTIVELLGKGGIGTVYLAKNRRTGDLEALKMLLPELTESAEMKERFGREISNSAILDHPNIIKVMDYGKCNDICYYAMEYCIGGSLMDLLRREGGILSYEKAVRITIQVLDGLEYAHNVTVPYGKPSEGSQNSEKGLIHRDIKPENILIQDTDKKAMVKIADFGLAKIFRLAGFSGKTRTGSVGGSPGFISRQQLVNFKYSKPEVDLWSATAVLYFLITGTTPRKCGNEKNPFNAVLKHNPVPIRKVDPCVPEGLASVIDRALDDSSSLFYKNAADLKRDIANCI